MIEEDLKQMDEDSVDWRVEAEQNAYRVGDVIRTSDDEDIEATVTSAASLVFWWDDEVGDWTVTREDSSSSGL